MTSIGRIYHEKRRILLPLFVFLVANIAVLGLGVVPLARSVRNLEQTAVQAGLEKARALQFDRVAKTSNVGKLRAEEELRKFYGEILPTSLRQAQSLTNFWLRKTAVETGLRFEGGQFKYDDIRDSRLMRMGGEFTLTGDYANIRRFLYAVETAPEFVVIEEVGLSQSQAAGRTSLVLRMTAATYWLTMKEGAPAR